MDDENGKTNALAMAMIFTVGVGVLSLGLEAFIYFRTGAFTELAFAKILVFMGGGIRWRTDEIFTV